MSLHRRPALLRRFAAAALTLLALASGACSAGDSTGPSTGPGPGTQQPGDNDDRTNNIYAVYTLVSVNGNDLSVPWETDGAFANYYTGGHIELRSNGTYVRSIRGRTVIPQLPDIIWDEEWTGTFTFYPSEPGADNGTIVLHQTGQDDTMSLTQLTITDVNQLPTPNGGMRDLIVIYMKE